MLSKQIWLGDGEIERLSSLAGFATVLLEGRLITKAKKGTAVIQLIDAGPARPLGLAATACAFFGLLGITWTFVFAVRSAVAVAIGVGLTATASTSFCLLGITWTFVFAVRSAVAVAIVVGCAATTESRFGLLGIGWTRVGSVGIAEATIRAHFFPIVIRKHPAAYQSREALIHVPA